MNLRSLIFISWSLAGAVASAANSAPAAASSSASAKAPPTPASASPARPTPAATTAATVIRVGGSDMLQMAVGEPLARYLQQTHANPPVLVDLQGSVLALSGLKSGATDLALIAAPVGQIPAPADFKAVLFCYSADYVIVHKDNPLTSLDLNQVASVFGTTQQSFTLWGQLRLTAEWAPRPIIAYSTSTDDGVVVELFKNQALKGTPLKATVRMTQSPQEMIKGVTDNPNAIGLGGFDPGTPDKVKVLLLSAPSGPAGSAAKDAVAPTPDNVFNGNYPLRLPYYLVYSPAAKARILPLLHLLLSPEYAGYLTREHFIPLSDTERNRALLELDKPN